MYKNILIPLDGSKLAESALPHAESLAVKYGSKLHLVRVVRPPTVAGREFDTMAQFQIELDMQRNDAVEYLNGLKGQFREKNIETDFHVGFGPVVAEIIDAAESRDVDLLIIASHGRSGLRRVFFGSVASGVLNRIERPLMVIRSSEA